MTPVCKDIFTAIHEGMWLKIEYHNRNGAITKYWIGICNLDVAKRTLEVRGMHLGTLEVETLNIYIDSIISSVVVDGTYCPVNTELVNDIASNPDKYRSLFDNVANLKILSYLEMCNKLDTTPYCTDFELIHHIDRETFTGDEYQLTRQQFSDIVRSFSNTADKSKKESRIEKIKVKQLAINVLSVHTKKGLYTLAYRKLRLDVQRRTLVPDDDITICAEFQIDGSTKESIRKYLDAEEYDLLANFEDNQELIKDAIAGHAKGYGAVDDMPYIIGIARDIMMDLHGEYRAIIDMYEKNNVTFPIRAFFGDLLEKPRRSKSYPIALIDSRTNLDQLLAINKAMMYPTAYIQGPPGTGKTNTILNTIVTAYFNDKTVLFASNNNHPIDSVFTRLCNLKYGEKTIPFPVLRLGNQEKVGEAIEYIRTLMESVEKLNVYEKTLDRRKDDRANRARELSKLLKYYEDCLDLEERKETLKSLLDYQHSEVFSPVLMPFEVDLQGHQLVQIENELQSMPKVKEEDAFALLDRNEEEFSQWLYYVSAKHIKRLNEEKYADLREILYKEDRVAAVNLFNAYIADSENVRKLQRVFPVIVTTCMSAHRLGRPEPLFDMTIIDEASQCNTAMSLVPIIRGENLMLVGDPQQLNPVILLDEFTNKRLRKEYGVTDEYDYRQNSIYKTFLASDSVSDEVLLHNHYRCHPRIIGFNNAKYYCSQLVVKSKNSEENPLVFIDVDNSTTVGKNTSVSEAEKIVEYVKANKDKNIGIITPFANQRELIGRALEEAGLQDVSCGTVHSFQGDEKDVVIFSTAVSSDTQTGTYEWLKTNRELINVATSRAKDKLIVMADLHNVERLHEKSEENDDLFELLDYVRSEGKTIVTPKETTSRALGVKPFSTETEAAFMQNLTHALENIGIGRGKYTVHKEVPISQVFVNSMGYEHLFYTGRFDYVVYEKDRKREIPVLAIELDGKEHYSSEVVRRRDEQKNKICKDHKLELIRVDNTYARRYNHIKSILSDFFATQF